MIQCDSDYQMKIVKWVDDAFRHHLSTDFKTTEVDTNTAILAIKIIGPYNAFKPRAVAKVMEKWKGKVEGYEVAREGSPCLYVHLPYWTGQREYSNPSAESVQIPKEVQEMTKEAIMKDFQSLTDGAPDEAETTPYCDNILRFWWD